MNRVATILALIFVFAFPVHAEQILGVGDSIMYGYGGATNGPLPTLGTYLSMTYYNGAVSGTCMSNAYTGLAALLSAHTPSRVYCNAGINDIRTWSVTCGSPLETWLTYYDSMLTDVTAAGATLYALQITPDCGSDYDGENDPSSTIKLWNAYLEEWAYTNNVALAPAYQDLCSTSTDDCLNASYTNDGLHPNAAADVVYGYLLYNAGIPSRSRSWGDNQYPLMGHESFSWWVITGTGSVTGGTTDGVTGKNDGGALSLASGASAVSNVISCIPSNLMAISTTLTQGAVTISYRTSTTNFARSAGSPSWISYTGPFSTENNFIQIKLDTSGETTALIDDATLDWNYTVSPSLHRVNLHRVNMR